MHVNTIQSIELPGCSLPAPALIALVGAGGKTSTAFWLAKLLKNQGCRVLVTTTTQMFHPQRDQYNHLYLNVSEQHLPDATSVPTIHYYAASYDPVSDKVSGLPPALVDQLKHSGRFDALIVEADGSQRLPLKAPAEHEPNLPNECDLVIGVCGAEALLLPADPDKIHRWPLFSALTGCCTGDLIDAPILYKWLSDPHGLFKSTPPAAKRIWQINKFDLSPSPAALCALSQQLLAQHTELQAVWLTDMQNAQPLRHNFQKPTEIQY